MIVTTTEPKQTTLYFREGNSDKVYHVSLEQNGNPEHFLVRFAFGRRGFTLQTGTKTATPRRLRHGAADLQSAHRLQAGERLYARAQRHAVPTHRPRGARHRRLPAVAGTRG